MGNNEVLEGFDDLLTANSFSFRWVRKSPLALLGSCSNKKRHIFLSRTPMAPCTNFSADTHECISLPVQSIDGLCSPIRTRHSCRLLCIYSIFVYDCWVVVYTSSLCVDGRQNLRTSDKISSALIYPIEIFIFLICVGSARQRHLPRIPSLF